MRPGSLAFGIRVVLGTVRTQWIVSSRADRIGAAFCVVLFAGIAAALL